MRIFFKVKQPVSGVYRERITVSEDLLKYDIFTAFIQIHGKSKNVPTIFKGKKAKLKKMLESF